ncbi:MAG: hypothetical protein IJ209_10290 [Bacteroidaceae bacterium]|nr:hypothetical protein [Bacteroidaceae bacterium]
MQALTIYIDNPGLLDATTVAELGQLVDQHPSFQAARLLYLRGLYQLQDERFGRELSRAAICMPDRQRLFELFEADVLQAAIEADQAVSAEKVGQEPLQPADRTLSLINTFLVGQPAQPAPRRPRPAEAAVDYTAYLMQLDDAAPEAVGPMHTEMVTLEPEKSKPIRQETPASVVETSATKMDETTDDEADDSEAQNDTADTYFTETLARIYIKQGKYAKAIEIIRRISLLYPQKNRYFADQIRFLEKLLLNESHKNERMES